MDAISTAGAGDALLAGTIAGLIGGMPFAHSKGSAVSWKRSISTAVDLGLTLAAVSVTSPHSIHPETTLESLLHFADTMDVLVPQSLIQAVIPTGANDWSFGESIGASDPRSPQAE